MAKIKFTLCVLSVIACFCLQISDASLCKPNSHFKLDCNSCKCSSSGMEFSCTEIICAPLIYKEKYLIEENEKGHTILKPKNRNSLDDANILNTNSDPVVDDNMSNVKIRRGQRYIYPYIRDEIPLQDNNNIPQYVDDKDENVDNDSGLYSDGTGADTENNDNYNDNIFNEKLRRWGRIDPR